MGGTKRSPGSTTDGQYLYALARAEHDQSSWNRKELEGMIRNGKRLIPGQTGVEQKKGAEHQSEANERKAPQAQEGGLRQGQKRRSEKKERRKDGGLWKERGRGGEDTASLGKKGGCGLSRPAILQWVWIDPNRTPPPKNLQKSRCITFRPCETLHIPRRFDI